MFFDFVFPINVNSLSLKARGRRGWGGRDVRWRRIRVQNPLWLMCIRIRDAKRLRKIKSNLFFSLFYFALLYSISKMVEIRRNGVFSSPTLSGAADRALASLKSFGRSTRKREGMRKTRLGCGCLSTDVSSVMILKQPLCLCISEFTFPGRYLNVCPSFVQFDRKEVLRENSKMRSKFFKPFQ